MKAGSCFLQNVFRPILEDYNYALTLGRFPNVKMIEKLPIGSTDVGVMSKIGVFEKIYEADWNGTIIPKKVDRGEWSLTTAQGGEPYRFVDYETLLENQKVITTLEQHTVYHYGCKWGCLIDKTIDEPKWNSAGWVLLEGDKNYYLDFIAPGTAKRGQVNMDITAWIKYANRDITNVLLATTGVSVEWLRDTGNVPADNSWKPVYVNNQKNVIHIDNTDEHGVGLGFGYDYQRVKFICRVFIPVGEDMEIVENYVGFRIKKRWLYKPNPKTYRYILILILSWQRYRFYPVILYRTITRIRTTMNRIARLSPCVLMPYISVQDPEGLMNGSQAITGAEWYEGAPKADGSNRIVNNDDYVVSATGKPTYSLTVKKECGLQQSNRATLHILDYR